MTQMTIQQAMELATQHHKAGRLREAETIYRQILEADPDQADALQFLGVIAMQVGKLDNATELIRRAIEINPASPHCHSNLGMVLAASGRAEEAIVAYRQALALNPNLADAHYNLGNVLRIHGRLPEAIEAYQRSLACRPGNLSALLNLANTLRENGQIDPATDAYRQALQVEPESAVAQYNLGLIHLLRGELEQGWPLYEYRTRARELSTFVEQPPGPPWDGQELNGRRILISTEQGFGDALQFARFMPAIAQRGGRVILRCQPQLKRLFQTVEGVAEVVSNTEPMPAFDLQRALLSLPALLNTRLSTIPSRVPYLRAEPQHSSEWRRRLPTNAFKVGLVWAGQANPNPRRSVPPDLLDPLSGVDGVAFVSLQKHATAQAGRPGGLQLLDWTDELHDFADTAALIDNLDLVITIDTAVAHLAGAMGKPLWVLLQCVPDWRWLLDRGDSPWYPTARLFRQPRPGDWNTPIHQVAEELRACRK